MKLAVLLFSISLLTVSCRQSDEGIATEKPSPVVNEVPEIVQGNQEEVPATSIPSPAASSLPLLALSFRTNVEYLTGFSNASEDKYDQAVDLVKKVVATEAFRKRVLNHLYNGRTSFANNNGLTNIQIYQSILDAAERLKPIKNNTLDVGVKLYYQNNSVVGYTSSSISYINVNTKFFNGFAPNQVAGNLFHEWLHKLGYGHDSVATARRPYSVPYAIGYIVRDLGKNFL
jgi:hypothetical protein